MFLDYSKGTRHPPDMLALTLTIYNLVFKFTLVTNDGIINLETELVNTISRQGLVTLS
jgi:hypothetical protein